MRLDRRGAGSGAADTREGAGPDDLVPFNFRLRKQVLDEIQEEARLRGISVADIIRDKISDGPVSTQPLFEPALSREIIANELKVVRKTWRRLKNKSAFLASAQHAFIDLLAGSNPPNSIFDYPVTDPYKEVFDSLGIKVQKENKATSEKLAREIKRQEVIISNLYTKLNYEVENRIRALEACDGMIRALQTLSSELQERAHNLNHFIAEAFKEGNSDHTKMMLDFNGTPRLKPDEGEPDDNEPVGVQ